VVAAAAVAALSFREQQDALRRAQRGQTLSGASSGGPSSGGGASAVGKQTQRPGM